MRRTHVKTDGFDGKYLVEGSAFPKVLGVKGAEGEAQPNHLQFDPPTLDLRSSRSLTNNDLYNASGTTDGDAHKRAIWTRQLNAIKAAVYESGHKLEVNAVGEFVIA